MVHESFIKVICNTLRMLGVLIYNNAFGREKKDMVRDPEKLIQFTWEKPKIQTVEDMKEAILGLAHMKGVKVTQKGKKVEF